jgi:NADP-dependent aldehyde dehydrogenase
VVEVISTNPATGEQRSLGFEESDDAAVLTASERAANALDDYAGRPLRWRAELLRAMAEELEGDAANLVTLANTETALPSARLEGELRRTAFQLRFFADVVSEGSFLDATVDHATDSPMGPLPDLRRLRAPIGVVGVFGSSNFPFAFSVPGGDTASALAAGCPVVIKAHPAHPATSAATFAALERAARRCDAPEGTVNLVFGFSAGSALVDAPGVSAVGFTGSVGAGLALWERANARSVPIPFFGELGSANPLVVTASAASERGTEIGTGLAGSMTLGVGQFCTKPGLVFVPSGEAGDALVAATVETLSSLGDFTMLSSSIAEHFRRGTEAIAAISDVRSLVQPDAGRDAHTAAQLYEVDAARFVGRDAYALREECFGPVALIVRFDSTDELRDALLASEPALTFSLFCVDDDPDGRWLLELGTQRSGRVIVNGFPTGVGVSWSMQHGGPWPSTTSSATSVGAAAIERWLRPVTFQSVPDDLLPPALQESNPLDLPRRVDGVLQLGH